MAITNTDMKTDLIINRMTRDIYNHLKEQGSLVEDQLYLIDEDNLDADGQPIVNVPDPILSSDAVNKNYVDANFVQLSGNQTINGTKTFNDSPSVPNITQKDDSSTKAANTEFVNYHVNQLSSKLNKINIDGSETSVLNLQHISEKEYAVLLKNDQALSNTLYVVSSDITDARGEQIKNVGDPTEGGDAVNKQYVDDNFQHTGDYATKTDLTAYQPKGNYLTAHQSLSNYYTKTETSSAAQVDAAISEKAAVTIDGLSSNVVNFRHVSIREYQEIVESPEGALSDTVYVVSSDTLNACGERFTNLGSPIESSDAATKAYVDATIADIGSQLTGTYYMKSETSSAVQLAQELFGKQTKLTSAQISAVDSGITSEKVVAYDGHMSDTGIHVTQEQKTVWNDKANVTIDGEDSDRLNLRHVSLKEYQRIVESPDGALSDTIYVVSSDTINMMGERIQNVGIPEDSSDATNKAYVDSLSDVYQSKGNYLTAINAHDGLSANGNEIVLTAASTQMYVDEERTISAAMKHVSVAEYAQILQAGANKNTLYVVSSDNVDMMNERVQNVADPIDDTDAVNKQYVDQIVGNVDTILRGIVG